MVGGGPRRKGAGRWARQGGAGTAGRHSYGVHIGTLFGDFLAREILLIKRERDPSYFALVDATLHDILNYSLPSHGTSL